MTTIRATAHPQRPAIAAMYAGLALTIAATVVLYVDHATANTLAGHIQAGYPAYSAARVDAAASVYLVYLTVLGALGVACWVAAIWAVRSGLRFARAATTSVFAAGTAVALFDLLVTDTSGDTGLPPLLGGAGLLPCVAGLVAVVLQWRRP